MASQNNISWQFCFFCCQPTLKICTNRNYSNKIFFIKLFCNTKKSRLSASSCCFYSCFSTSPINEKKFTQSVFVNFLARGFTEWNYTIHLLFRQQSMKVRTSSLPFGRVDTCLELRCWWASWRRSGRCCLRARCAPSQSWWTCPARTQPKPSPAHYQNQIQYIKISIISKWTICFAVCPQLSNLS